jgi:hypothetical protein
VARDTQLLAERSAVPQWLMHVVAHPITRLACLFRRAWIVGAGYRCPYY